MRVASSAFWIAGSRAVGGRLEIRRDMDGLTIARQGWTFGVHTDGHSVSTTLCLFYFVNSSVPSRIQGGPASMYVGWKVSMPDNDSSRCFTSAGYLSTSFLIAVR